MKTILELFKPILKDRRMLLAMFLVFIFGIIFFAFMLFNVEFSDSLVYVRYTFFGTAHLYKDSWVYRISLSLLGIIISTLHLVVIAKIYSLFGRRTAVIFSILSIVVVILGLMVIGLSIREIPN